MNNCAQVRLLRPIRYMGDVVDAGTVLTVTVPMAAELVNARKAVPHVEEPAAAPEEAMVVVDASATAGEPATDQPPAEQA